MKLAFDPAVNFVGAEPASVEVLFGIGRRFLLCLLPGLLSCFGRSFSFGGVAISLQPFIQGPELIGRKLVEPGFLELIRVHLLNARCRLLLLLWCGFSLSVSR